MHFKSDELIFNEDIVICEIYEMNGQKSILQAHEDKKKREFTEVWMKLNLASPKSPNEERDHEFERQVIRIHESDN